MSKEDEFILLDHLQTELSECLSLRELITLSKRFDHFFPNAFKYLRDRLENIKHIEEILVGDLSDFEDNVLTRKSDNDGIK